MTYQDAIAYVHSFTRFGMRPGLERISALLDRLDRPHEALPAVHIGGTNGKGSTAAMLEAMLRAAGYRTGMTISPYLEHFCERIQLGGRPVSEEAMAALVARGRAAVERMTGEGAEPPTEFEFITALAFLAFAEAGVDCAVVEVGLGGTYDATNVLPRPLVSVLTHVGLDHTEILGDTVAQIARDKAGIIRPAGRVVSGADDPAAAAVIAEVAAGRGASLLQLGRDFAVEEVSASYHGQILRYRGPAGERENVYCYLLGRHQQRNAAIAMAAADVLTATGLEIPEPAVRQGLQDVRWPGRLEVLHWNPLVVLDGAHNPSGARALAAAMDELFSWIDRTLVFGVLADKDVDGIAAAVVPGAARVICTRPDSPRALAPDALAEVVRRHATGDVTVEPDVERALEAGLDALGPHALLLVTGSLYLVGDARRRLVPRLGEPGPVLSPDW